MTQHFLLTIDPDMVDWARAQFAITAIYHWLFVPLTLGLALIMGIMETCYYRTKKRFWRDTAKFWQKLFGKSSSDVFQKIVVVDRDPARCRETVERFPDVQILCLLLPDRAALRFLHKDSSDNHKI